MLSFDTDKMNILIDFQLALLDCSSTNGSSSRNVDGLIDRHQELLLSESLWHLESPVHSLTKLFHGLCTKDRV